MLYEMHVLYLEAIYITNLIYKKITDTIYIKIIFGKIIKLLFIFSF